MTAISGLPYGHVFPEFLMAAPVTNEYSGKLPSRPPTSEKVPLYAYVYRYQILKQ